MLIPTARSGVQKRDSRGLLTDKALVMAGCEPFVVTHVDPPGHDQLHTKTSE